MGRTEQPDGRPGGTVKTMRTVHSRKRSEPRTGGRAPSPTPTSYQALIPFIIITFPDLANLLPEWNLELSGRTMPLQWTAWLAMLQLSMGALCLWAPTAGRWLRYGACLWFALQCVDQLVAGNFFKDGLLEYPLLAVYLLTIAYLSDDTKRTA